MMRMPKTRSQARFVLLWAALTLTVACKDDQPGVVAQPSDQEEDGAGGLNDACTSSEDCAEDLVCNQGRSICVECIVDDDCGTAERCEAGSCEALPRCATAEDCPAGDLCDEDREICVECLGDENCDSGSRCVDDACRTECSSDADCDGVRCDSAAALCVECLEHDDCSAEQYCTPEQSCQSDVCEPASTQCSGQDLLTCNGAGSGLDAAPCAEGCEEAAGSARCTGPAGAEPEAATGAEPDPATTPNAEPETTTPEPSPEPDTTEPTPSSSDPDATDSTTEPEPETGPEPTPEPGVEPDVTVEPEPVLSGTPAVLIVADRSSSMLEASVDIPNGSSPAYGSFSDRWEALRAIVASLDIFADDIHFSLLTYEGFTTDACLNVRTTASAVSAAEFTSLVAALPPSVEAAADVKAEAPANEAILAATDQLLAAAPDSPKYLLLITRGTPDTCLVRDPQCGADETIAAIQDAHALGITTLVVSLHGDTEMVPSNDFAHAGRGLEVEPPLATETTELSCIASQRTAEGQPFDYLDWRPYASATYAADGFVYAEDLSYTGLNLDPLHAALAEIAAGTF